ncbi:MULTISPECIES: hypothetical protein [Nocardioides]|uniref:Tyr recombinase domain-containing protein n=1 Tax=Nocardioides oceani TaxID=3058369 RepID=A0ABT8FM34_9ACTN|nr:MULTISPECIES: hypothetical protein [Nocardioides]MDN4175227.1 hypothetical protein [Nocardioides oceani]WKN46657.1 hypothetical protein OSR43_11415 [Nocardioides sp. Arc9.136]
MPAPGPNAALRLPPKCNACQSNRVAWTRPRVDFCYQCLPGGPFAAPPCNRCRSRTDYFSQGLCSRCHPRSSEHVGSCKGCLAWGVYPRYNWTCWSCRWWQRHYPKGTCSSCGRTSHVSDRQACRLCLENARLDQEPGRAPDVTAANQHSQQLFFANMVFKRRATPVPDYVRRDRRWSTKTKNQLPYEPGTSFDDNALEQLILFDMDPDPAVLRQRLLVEDSELTRYCAAIVADHARRYGWSVKQRNAVTQSLRLLQILRPTSTAKVRASDVVALRRYDGTITSTLDVLAEAGLLIEDVPTRVERYFNAKFIESGALPDTMRGHLQLWLQIMLGGSRQAPRQVPREPETVEIHIQGLAPVVQAWVEAGRQSFAEISTDDILAALAALPAGTSHRHFAEIGLKSLFKILKGRRLVFTNPIKDIDLTRIATNLPLPLDPALIRAELDSPNSALALAVALVAFHGLTGKQVRELQLSDIVDGRLHLDGRDIPLAAPVRTRLSAWLDHRNRTWPATANPHLLINRRTAPRLVPGGPSFPWRDSRVRPRALREDRILHEIHATGGDVRRIYDLFGLSVEGATRYLKTIEHPDLRNKDHPGNRT